MQKVVFLDRDGVINVEKDYLYKIEDFEFIDGVFETLFKLQSLDYKLVIVTNQSGIGRGYYTQKDFDILTSWMKEEFIQKGINIDAVYCCPHTPLEKCNCRKPNTGMIEQYAKIVDIDYNNSWMVGDKSSDIELAINANISNTVQVKTGHTFDPNLSKAKYVVNCIKDIPLN